MPISIDRLRKLEPVTAEDDERLIKEAKNENCKQHYKKHRQKRIDYQKRYLKKHRNYGAEQRRKYYQTQRGKESKQRYCRTLKGRKVRKKSAAKTNAKRNRGLEFELLNEPFEGSEGHHVTKKTVLFIPKELHRSIRHNVFTGEGMEEINKLAFEWLDRKLIKAAFNILIK